MEQEILNTAGQAAQALATPQPETANIAQNVVKSLLDIPVQDLEAALAQGTQAVTIASLIIMGIAVLVWIIQAILVGALARSKGYSFFGNFLLGLIFGTFALIYEAGRPVSYERECVMQDRLALQTAKELYKLQRARERAQAGIPKASIH